MRRRSGKASASGWQARKQNWRHLSCKFFEQAHGFERCGCHRTPCYIRDKVARITLSQRQLRSGSHSGLLEPRGASTVRNPPGVRDMTIWSVIP